MSCETARLLMEKNDPALAAHVESCASCIIGANAPYYTAPPGLEQKIHQALDRETQHYWRWGAIAASVFLLISLGANIAQFRSRVSTADEIWSAHVRSLTGTHLLDVPSSDMHTVKPWFNGKVDFSPPVKTVPGFPLIGGRLEYFEGRPAAALIYGRNQHIINLFTWPGSAAASSQIRNGYRMQSWSANGMAFWAVTDLNDAEFREFISLYRDQ